MTSEMNTIQAFGWIAAAAINQEFDGKGECCVKNCGMCMALHWFMQNDRTTLEAAIRLTGFHDNWELWDEDLDCLRWDVIREHWGRHQACWSDEVGMGCYPPEDDPEEDEEP